MVSAGEGAWEPPGNIPPPAHHPPFTSPQEHPNQPSAQTSRHQPTPPSVPRSLSCSNPASSQIVVNDRTGTINNNCLLNVRRRCGSRWGPDWLVTLRARQWRGGAPLGTRKHKAIISFRLHCIPRISQPRQSSGSF